MARASRAVASPSKRVSAGSPAAPNAIAWGKRGGAFETLEAPRSKSPPTMRGIVAIRCKRFKNAATLYGSAFWMTRPLEALLRIRPPTLVSRIRRMNLRMLADRVLGIPREKR